MTYHDVTNGPCACGAWHDAIDFDSYLGAVTYLDATLAANPAAAMPNLPTEAEIIFEADAPSPYRVELDGDIIGTGSTENEAIVEALETVAGWGRWNKS